VELQAGERLWPVHWSGFPRLNQTHPANRSRRTGSETERRPPGGATTRDGGTADADPDPDRSGRRTDHRHLALGLRTVALTASFAVGAAAPLLLFALAGAKAAERIKAFRTRARTVPVVAGVVMNSQLTANSGPTNAQLVNCPSGSPVLHSCGPAPALKPTSWLNTPGDAPIDLASLKGGVTLVDFWTYSCINCQRDIPHVEAWYNAYRAAGLNVIGVHAPEFVFERDVANVKAGAKSLGVTYPIAVDNKLATWTAYRNQYWPALYLIDATGMVRSINFGEGNYQQTETMIRQLLTAAHPAAALPEPTDVPDATLAANRTPETYLSYNRLGPSFAGSGLVHNKATAYALLTTVPDDRIGLDGRRPERRRRRRRETGLQLPGQGRSSGARGDRPADRHRGWNHEDDHGRRPAAALRPDQPPAGNPPDDDAELHPRSAGLLIHLRVGGPPTARPWSG
jgi:thiol-disulfide isomerase/thioredoxin